MILRLRREFSNRKGMATSKDIIYRELLALDRTNLAVDRTLLAYWRTSLTMLVIGITLIKLFNSTILMVLGWFLIPLAIGLSIVGTYRCRNLKNRNNGQPPTLSRAPVSIQTFAKLPPTRLVSAKRKAVKRES